MEQKHKKIFSLLGILFFFFYSHNAFANFMRGIYITESTAKNAQYLTYLIDHSKAVGINTFIVDLVTPSQLVQKNMALLKENGIYYVARIVMYPGGGTPDQVASTSYLNQRYALIQDAIQYGAQAIQLDYIRFNTKQPPSPRNAEKINAIIGWIKNKLDAEHIPLQIDVFGIASFGSSQYIGHDIKLFAPNVDAICPMVYPSHYEPYKIHAQKPYEIIAKSLDAIKQQFAPASLPFQLYPYLELYNYRYPLTEAQKLQYITAEIQAVHDSNANGWYIWNPFNRYDILFKLLKSNPGL